MIPVIVGTVPRRYTVFLSYRHADNKEQGRQRATWLHQMLESYEVPPDLVGTPDSRGEPIPASLYPVFRDEEELSADADLTSRIREALENSALVVVLCSPRSVASRFVADEIRYFKELGAADRILALLIDGAPHAPTDPTNPSSGADADLECLPEPLRFGMARPDGSMDWTVPAEPIAADARPRGEPVQGWTTAAAYREQLEREALLDREAVDREVREYEQRLDRARLKIIAGALAVPLGTLTKRDKSMQLAKQRERLRILRRWLMAVAVLAVLATAGGLLAWVKQREATEQSERRRLLLAEAARSDRLAAEDKLGTDEAPGAFAYLGRALSYDPSSTLSAEKAVVALNGWRFPPPMAICQGHANWVASARFSADGERLVTASGDSTARLWETRSGKLIGVLEGHQNSVNAAEFSPDGRRVVTASTDNTARIWDAQSGKAVVILRDHRGSVNAAEFSSDGTRVLTASTDNTARIWDARSGKVLVTLEGHAGSVNTAKFSPDGKRVVTASSDNAARVWDAQTGRERVALSGHAGWVHSAWFSPNGERIVTASSDSAARMWDATNGKPTAILKGHEVGPLSGGGVLSARFSPDGQHIVTTSTDRTARVWQPEGGELIRILKSHEGDLSTAALSPDEERIAAVPPESDTAEIWDVKSGRVLAILRGHAAYVQSAEFSPDRQRVVTAAWDNTSRVWSADDGEVLAILRGHEGYVQSAHFSSDGQRIVTASNDNTVRVWEAHSGKQLVVVQVQDVQCAQFSPDRRWLVTGSLDKTARVWDAQRGTALVTLEGHNSGVRSVQFSPDGQRIVTTAEDATDSPRVWDARSGKPLAVLAGHQGQVRSAEFSPDGEWIVTASLDKTARVWASQSGALLTVLKGHEKQVMSAQFSADGQRIVTASSDGVRIWTVLPSSAGTPPEWFRDFLHLVAQQRLSADGELNIVPSNEWLGIQARLRHVSQDAGVPETSYLRILRRFVHD